MAIDERRRSFPPTLWDNLEALNAAAGRAPTRSAGSPATTARSAAAAGTALSDDALLWVAEGAAAAGLALDPAALAAWRARPRLARAARGAARRGCCGGCWRSTAADRAGPARLGEVAEAAVRRWRADPSYRPGALARVAAALGAG